MAAPTKTNRHLECKDLHSYLQTLPPPHLDKLYDHPATCIAVFRELPVLARHYVMRTLFVENPVSQTVVSSWVTTNNQSNHAESLKVLMNLRVWHNHNLPGGLPGCKLNDIFRHNLKVALLGGGQPWTGSAELPPDRHGKDAEFLDQYGMERWECCLHYMVGSTEGASGVSRDVVNILLFAGLMKVESTDTEPCITPAGFQFLLLDTASQVWYFMLQYLETIESRGMDLVETLAFLFQLSFFTLGKDYSTDGMTENQLRFLQHLREFGLVYQRKRKSQRFYPTQLALNLVSGASKSTSIAGKEGYLVIETNFRTYAYTTSSLQVALLSLFCEIQYRFPNMCVASITRDSVREALSRGITAQQIIHFLLSHIHPEMQKSKPYLPATISDQVRLWELERDRFKFTDGVLYSQFLSSADFEVVRDYAKDLGVMIWENPDRRTMVVQREGHDDVKRFWKRHKPS